MRLMTVRILTLGLSIGSFLWGGFVHAQGPTISSISPTSGAEGTAVTISGSGFGATQGTSTLSFNGTTATASTWTDSTIVAILPSGVPSGPFTVTVNGTAATTSTFRVTPLFSNLPLPSVWEDDAIRPAPQIWFTTAPSGVPTGGSVLIEDGNVSWASATFSNGQFTLENNGAIGGTADDFHFVDQPLSGDGVIVARVVSVSGSGYPQAGVMIRETLDAGASNAFTGYYGDYAGMVVMNRANTGANEGVQVSMSANAPYWVELVRSGNTFSSYVSTDGVNWAQFGTTATITMAQSVYVGLAVGMMDGSGSATATFDNVSISSTTVPAPVITGLSATTGSIGSQVVISGSGFGAFQGSSVVMLNGSLVTVNFWSATSIAITIPPGATSGPLVVSVAPSMNDSNPIVFTVTSQPLPNPWLDRDIGQVGTAGSATFASGTFTVQGSGVIDGTPEATHFVYEPLSGDGAIVARVVSVSGSGYPQAGVMIRETLDAGASNAFTGYYGWYGGMVFMDRTSTGASEGVQNYITQSVPYWVELVRSGDTFSSYVSADGVNWVQLGSPATITMAQNVYVGLAVGMRNGSGVATATFDNVSVSSSPGSGSSSPVITSLSQTSGSVGTQIIISGTNFGSSQGSGTVTFNGTSATPTSWSATSIVTTVPTGATTGTVVVTVGGTASNGVNFIVGTTPAITELSPFSGAVGTSVTITGANFGAAQGTSTVTFNGTSATPTSWSATSIVTTVPTGATTGTVMVTVGATVSNGLNFVVGTAPTITSLSPTSGGVGTSVTITGMNFGSTQGSSTVSFNETMATATSWSDTGIVTTVPAGATTGNVIAIVAGLSSNSALFTFEQGPLALLISSPTDGTVVYQGQTITVSVTSPSGLAFTQVGLIGEDPLGLSTLNTSVPAQFSIAIPSGMSCRLYALTAGGAMASGENVLSAPIELDVERPDPPTSLSAPLASLTLGAQGEQEPVQVLATFSDGSILDVTESSYMSYASSNQNVATVDATGMVTAVGPGSASIAAVYSQAGQAVTGAAIQVTVSPFVIAASPSSLSFGSATIGTASAQTLTLTNSGSSPLDVLSVNGGGDFSETDNCVSSSPLVAGGSCLITVTFAPTITGPESGTINIATDVQGAQTAIPVSGTGSQ
jgi:regulation of enolase protein 1 (concanavalin A-like superfamily)